ncbi:MAG: GNAT family N-acetyltransferase [Clostridia bacterium]|nr:GNAT family N-acetyltransferase [Clostridia bacterium]
MYRGKFLMSGMDTAEVINIRSSIPEFLGAGTDEFDKMAIYALIFDEEDIPCGCGRLFIGADSRFRIDTVGVLPTHRKRFVGDLIARMLLYKAQELNAGSVRIIAPNETAVFFSRYGFRSLSEETTHFGKPAIVMHVDGDKISLEGTCSCGHDGACKGDCASCQ